MLNLCKIAEIPTVFYKSLMVKYNRKNVGNGLDRSATEKRNNMNEQRLKTLLYNHPWHDLVQCVDTVPSTNAAVKALASNGAPEGTAMLADTQTQGRGRLGRTFCSEKGGLYLSVLLRPERPAADLLTLTARTAVCVRQAIIDVCSIDTQIKWVNDLYLHGKKVCGILTELVGGEKPAAVVGIGINCDQIAFPEELRDIASSLYAETGRQTDKEALAAAILQNLSNVFNTPWLDTYRAACMNLGKPVKVLSPQGEKDAFAVDITDTAALTVRYPDGTVEDLSSGEVSVRSVT